MSWLVDIEIKPSPINGLGVFAKQDIWEGEWVWQLDNEMFYCNGPVLKFLNADILTFALKGGYLHVPTDLFVWYDDGMEYMNHSNTPNTDWFWSPISEEHTVARRDIKCGEELTENYLLWSQYSLYNHWLHDLYSAHTPEHLSFLRGLK